MPPPSPILKTLNQSCMLGWPTKAWLWNLPSLPLSLSGLKVRTHLPEGRAEVHHPHNVLPPLFGEPSREGVELGCLLKGQVSFQEELQVLMVEQAITVDDADGHLERQHELVLLKQAGACVVVEVICEGVNDVAQSAVKGDGFWAGRKGDVEHLQEGVEGVLVHVVDGRQGAQHKE